MGNMSPVINALQNEDIQISQSNVSINETNAGIQMIRSRSTSRSRSAPRSRSTPRSRSSPSGKKKFKKT